MSSVPQHLEVWRNNQHRFNTIPEKIQGDIRLLYLSIPPDAKTPIPSTQISVLELVAFKIPPSPNPGDGHAPLQGDGVTSFFSAEAPEADHSTLLANTPIPPRRIVADLLAVAAQQWLNGANSITVPGSQGHLPLWAAQVWATLSITVCPEIDIWKRSLPWLRRQELLSFPDQINSTMESLSTFSWAGHMLMSPQASGYPKKIISEYLSHNWLTDEHIDQLLTLLEAELSENLQDGSTSICLISTVVFRAVIQAFNESSHKVYDPAGEHFLAKFGARLTAACRIGGIYHVRGNHWVAFTIDLQSKTFSYGDPISKLWKRRQWIIRTCQRYHAKSLV